MAKGLGKFLGLATLVGLAVAGYSVYKQYKQEAEDMSYDSDDDFEEEPVPVKKSVKKKKVNYPELKDNKEIFIESAKETLGAAKGMLVSGVELAKSAGKVLADDSADLETKAKAVYEDNKIDKTELLAKGALKAADVIETAKDAVHVAREALDKKLEEFAEDEIEEEAEEIDIDDIVGENYDEEDEEEVKPAKKKAE